MKQRTKIICCLLACLAYLICYIPAFTMQYQADDFGEIVLWNRYGLGMMVYQYYHWTGKFGQPLLSGLFKLFPIWLPTIIVLSLWWLFVALIIYKITHDKALAIGGSAFLLTCLIVSLPARGESIYWQASLTTHTSAAVTFTFVFWLLIQHRFSPRLTLALLFTCGFFAAGFSEVGVAFIPLLMLIGQPRRRLVALTGASLGWGITLLSPGNAIRAAYFPHAPLIMTLPYVAASVPGYIHYNVLQAPLTLIALVIGTWCAIRLWSHTKQYLGYKDKILLIELFGMLIASILLAFTPTYIINSGTIPDRAWIIPQVVFIAVIARAIFAALGESAAVDTLRGVVVD